jgi:hypothetical protein
MQAVAFALCERARKLMQPENKEESVNPSTRALAHIVEAALCAVPTSALEAIIHGGLRHPAALEWRQAMDCDLVTDKVQSVMGQLAQVQEAAGSSLRQVFAAAYLRVHCMNVYLFINNSRRCTRTSRVPPRAFHAFAVCCRQSVQCPCSRVDTTP